MKWLFWAGLASFFSVASPLFSEENMQEEQTFMDDWLPPLLVHNSNFFHIMSAMSAGSFQFIDGTPVSRNEVFALIGSLPENQTLMREIRSLRNTSSIILGISAGIVATGIVYQFAGSQERRREIMASTGMIAVSGIFLTFSLVDLPREKRIFRAVDNYNLHILGISTPGSQF